MKLSILMMVPGILLTCVLTQAGAYVNSCNSALGDERKIRFESAIPGIAAIGTNETGFRLVDGETGKSWGAAAVHRISHDPNNEVFVYVARGGIMAYNSSGEALTIPPLLRMFSYLNITNVTPFTHKNLTSSATDPTSLLVETTSGITFQIESRGSDKNLQVTNTRSSDPRILAFNKALLLSDAPRGSAQHTEILESGHFLQSIYIEGALGTSNTLITTEYKMNNQGAFEKLKTQTYSIR